MSPLNKHVLAAFYSDARVNILYCLNDVREKTGLAPIRDEADILNGLDTLSLTTTTPEYQRERIRLLRNRFRFIDPATDVKPNTEKPDNVLTGPARYERLLRWMFRLISDQRNALVHPTELEYPITHRVHKDLFFDLGKIYDGSLREVAKRFTLDPNIISPLLRYDKKTRLKPLNRFSLALCVDPAIGKNRDGIRPSDVIHDFGRVLLCALFLEKSQIAELADYFWRSGHDRYWNEQQQAIARELLGVYRIHLPVQRLRVDDTTTAVTIDTLSELSRCPRPLLDILDPRDQARFRTGPSLNDAQALAEHEDNEASFLLVRGHTERFVPLMMRFFDFDPDNRLRFAVDLGQYFYNVRFKPGDRFTDGRPRVRRLARKLLAYGRLSELDSTPKPETCLQLEANHLQSADEEQAAIQRASGAIETLRPYIVPASPHYHYATDRIGFCLAADNEPATYPDLTIAGGADGGAVRPTKRDMEPAFWACPDQLLDFGFYAYLQKTDDRFQRLDVVVNRYHGGMRRLVRALADGAPELGGSPGSAERRASAQQWIDGLFGRNGADDMAVAMADLPKVITHHLLKAEQRSTLAGRILKRVEHLIGDAEHRRRQIDNLLQGFKKRGKKGFRPIKCGTIGDFLSEDLLRFQPTDETRLDTDGGKLNSQQYQILQAALAYYGAHLDEPPRIVDLLRDTGLLDGDFAHPFLPRLGLSERPEKYPGLISFYQAYLDARLQFLKQYQSDIRDSAADAIPPRWLRLRQQSSLDTWLQGYRRPLGDIDIGLQPLPIPRNLLYHPILAMVAKATGTTTESLCEAGTRRFDQKGQDVAIPPSVTWLLKRYLAHRGESAQEMYGYPRRHDLIDNFLDRREGKQLHKPKPAYFLSEPDRKDRLAEIREFLNVSPEHGKAEKLTKLLSAYRRQERQINRTMAQDMLLYLYARSFLDDAVLLGDASTSPAWSLEGIAHTLLNTPIQYRMPIGPARELLHPACKVRNLGEVRLLARDKRLPSLLAYYPGGERTLYQAEVREELSRYRRSRVAVMELVHQLEKAIAVILPTDGEVQVPLSVAGYFGGRHGKMLFMLFDRYQRYADAHDEPAEFNRAAFETTCFDRAREIRNRFSHNQYPDASLFPDVVAAVAADAVPAKHRQVAERLLKRLNDLYTPWLAFLDHIGRSK